MRRNPPLLSDSGGNELITYKVDQFLRYQTVRDDILLFRAIIKDLFPGVQEPNVTYDALEKCLDEVIDAAGLQKPKDFTIKCIQLYEMTVVRHGMMLVGPTGGGKTRVLRSLQAAMSKVQDDPAFDKVRVYRLNPKSITMNQLYGSFDLQTGEWTGRR